MVGVDIAHAAGVAAAAAHLVSMRLMVVGVDHLIPIVHLTKTTSGSRFAIEVAAIGLNRRRRRRRGRGCGPGRRRKIMLTMVSATCARVCVMMVVVMMSIWIGEWIQQQIRIADRVRGEGIGGRRRPLRVQPTGQTRGGLRGGRVRQRPNLWSNQRHEN